MSNSPVILLTNNANSTLAGPISSGATTATLAAGTGSLFPAPSAGQYFPLTFIASSGLSREIVHVTARSTDTITIVRAQEGTVGTAFAAGDLAVLMVTAGTMSSMSQIAAEQTAAAQSFADPGYQVLNNGLIIQWGHFATTTGNNETVTFPIAFPTACLGVTCSEGSASGWVNTPPQPTWIGAASLTTTNFKIYAIRLVGGVPVYGGVDDTQWFAWGH